MRKVGTLKRLVVALSATAVVLVVAAVSGAAPGTDASVTTFDQCANGAPPGTSTGCPENWINGILNANNSHYAEDDVTPQRVILELPKASPATGRTVEISYLTRKGGVHAYDSLATWNHTQTSADRCANLSTADCVPGSASTLPVPGDPTVVADNDGSGSATSGHQLAGQAFTLYGGTLTGASSYTHDDASGTSDSYAHITLTYSVPTTADGAKVMLLFGGHIAPGLGPRGWGAGVGAGSISGGPYHVRITAADGASVGNRDNQIMSGAILSPANIVIRKNTVGGDGAFDYTATGGISSGFSIATSGGTGSQSFTNISVGAYTVTESGPPAGWDFTNLVCVDEDSGSSVDLALRKANIDLDPGETVTCTYTNTKRGQIIVDKVTAPSGDPQSFPFTLTGGPDGINQGFNLADATTPHDSGLVKPGTYAAAETSVPAGWDLTSSCSDGSAPGSIALAAGETVTCTFTNTRKAALTVIKHVINDNGGSKTASQFPIQVSGSSPSPASFAGAEAPGTSVAIGQGAYNVTETEDPGYAASYSAGCAGNLPAGGSATCTITNNDKPATLTVIKHVVNDNGGTALASAFTMTISGVTAQGGNSFPGAEAPGVTTTLTSVGAYNVSESSLPGYTQTSASADCSGTIALGESKTCTITNDDVAARLIVIKTVVNDNGGSAVSSNWTMNVAGPTNLSFAGEVAPGTNSPVNPGAYKVTESGGPGGYALSYSGDCDADGDVTVPLGQTKTCVLTNDDQQATITVIKHVINDNGGTALASAFTMTISGVTAQGGNSFPGAAAPGVVKTITTFGDYDVTEGAVTGHTQTSASADCAGTIALGQHKTCTITNDDVAPRLTLVKQVVNDNGGSAQPSAWNLAAAGPSDFSGAGPSVSSPVGFDAGSYDLSETGPDGYDASSWVCSKGQVDGDSVSVGLGDDITCTITNDDNAPKLTLLKEVVNDNGGSAQPSAWTLNAAGPTGFSGLGPSVSNGPSFDAGSYDLSETGPDGYDASSWVCSNGQVDGDSVSVGLGDDITCTITNDDNAPKLTLVKIVVNDNGGTALPSAWNLAAAGPTGFSGAGPSFSSGAGFDSGTYDLSESGGPEGYDAGAWDCTGESQTDDDTVSVGLGGQVTCTITNNDKPATLIVKKVVVNDNGGSKVASDFSFQVNGGAAQSFDADGQNNLTVGAGTYDVTELGVAGYTTTYQGCANIVLLLGGTATCTVTNNDVPRGQGSIDVQKSVNPTSVKEPGGQVAYSVRITNTSADVDVHITNVVDDKFGDLDDDGGNGCFDVPINLAPGQFASCQFTKQVTGVGGTTHVNTVTASGTDENGNPVSDSDDARVNITERLIDLVIVKYASSPTPLNGIVNYSLTVTNKGPDTATNVQLADPAPAGITYLTANPSQGTCNLSPSLITCSLGSIAAGQTVTIAITGRATAVGSHTNTATATGGGGRETNPADNVDSAVTVVAAPFRPPTVKPPVVETAVCLSLSVSPKMIKADGKPDKVTATVTAGKKRVKGVKVVVRGAGVSKAAKTNGDGVAVLRFNAKKPGLITVTVAETNQKLCGPKRIGVVGVFLPPLTG